MSIILIVLLVWLFIKYRRSQKDLLAAQQTVAHFRELEESTKSLEEQKNLLQEELKQLDLDILVGMVKIDDYGNLKSDEVKNKLALLRGKQDELVKSGSALKITSNKHINIFKAPGVLISPLL